MINEIVPDDYYCVIDTSSSDVPSRMNCLESKNAAQAICVDRNKMDIECGKKSSHQMMTVVEWREKHYNELVARINEMDDIHKWWWVIDQAGSVTVLLKPNETCVIIDGAIGDPIIFDAHLGTFSGVGVLLDILDTNHEVM